MKQHNMNTKETTKGNYIMLPSDKNDNNEAHSRIIQRLTAVGIIKPEHLTEDQQNVILELCGLDRLKTKPANVINVTFEPYTDPLTIQEFVGREVMDKLRNTLIDGNKEIMIRVNLKSV